MPDPALIVLVGPAGCGKSTFARRHFGATEVVSSDACRAMVADDENDLSATPAAFQLVRLVAGLRLERRRLTVVDATNVKVHDRMGLVALARRHPGARGRHRLRPPRRRLHRQRPAAGCPDGRAAVIRAQLAELGLSLPRLEREGFGMVHVLSSEQAAAQATIERVRPGRAGAPFR